jgi:hypothetical protein
VKNLHYPLPKQSFKTQSIQTNKFGCKMLLYCLKQTICHGMHVGSPDLYKQNEKVKPKRKNKRVGRQKTGRQTDSKVRRLSQRDAWLSLTSQSDLRK